MFIICLKQVNIGKIVYILNKFLFTEKRLLLINIFRNFFFIWRENENWGGKIPWDCNQHFGKSGILGTLSNCLEMHPIISSP